MHISESKTKPRRLVAPNLQTIEQRNVTDTAKVTVMLRPTERESVFTRIVEKRISTPEREAANHGVPRSLILHTLHVEYDARVRKARLEGYAIAKRENLLPPGGAAAMRKAA